MHTGQKNLPLRALAQVRALGRKTVGFGGGPGSPLNLKAIRSYPLS